MRSASMIFYYILLFSLMISKVMGDTEGDPNHDQMTTTSSGVVVNIITGGSIQNLNHLDQSENHYHLELMKFVGALRNETCGNNSLIDVVNLILRQKGVVNFDLRNLFKNDSLVSSLSNPLTPEQEDMLKFKNLNLGTVHSGTQQFKTGMEKIKMKAISNNNLIKVRDETKTEILSSKGPHLDLITTNRLDLGAMLATSTDIESWRENETINNSLNYFRSKMNFYVNKMERLVGQESRVIRTPKDICEIYREARNRIHDADTENTLALVKILKNSLDCFIEILRIKQYSDQRNHQIDTRGMMGDQSHDVPNIEILMGKDLDELRLIKNEIALQIKTIKKEVKPTNPGSLKSRMARSIGFMKSLTNGVFSGFILKDDIDVSPYLDDKLLYPKLRITNRVFTGTYWPECHDYPQTIESDIGTGMFRSVLLSYLTSHGICFFCKFCNMGEYVHPKTKLCFPASTASDKHLTNMRSIGISDYIHRIGPNELDDSLERRFEGYCSVGGIQISSCHDTIASSEVISLSRISGEWIIIRNDIHVGYNSDLDMITSYDCTATNISQLDSKEHPGYINGCNKGDDDYLKRFKGNKDCSCGISLKSGDITVKYYDNLIPVDFIFQLEVTIKKPASTPKKRTCTDCNLSCEDGILSLTNIPKYDVMAVCKMGYCEFFNIQNQKQKFSLSDPRPFLGEITFKLYPNSTDLELFKGKSTCSLDDFCKLIKCIVCRDFLLNPHCQPMLSIMVWSILLIIPLLLINILSSTLSLFFRGLKLIIYSIMKLIGCCFIIWRGIGKISKRRADQAYSALSEVEITDDVKVEYANVKKSNQRTPLRPFMLKPINPITVILIIGLGLSIVSSCSIESIVSSDSMHCTSQGSGSKCVIKQDTQISLSPIGQISCLNIKKTGSNEILSQIQIKTKTLRLLCNPSILYYTASVTPQMTSTYRCSGAGSCNDDNCKQIKPEDNTPEIPSQSVFNHTGETGCRLVNGFWGNSCFFADSACKYYRVFFTSKGDSYEVYNCPTWEWIAELEVTTIDAATSIETVHLTTSQPYVKDTLTVRLTSVSVKPNILYSKCFMRKVARMYEGYPIAAVECNIKTESSAGVVGEIQCPTAKDADDMTLKCSYMKNLFSVYVNGNDLVFRSGVIDVDDIYKSNLLPSRFTGMTLENTMLGVPYINTHEASLFTLHLSMKDYQISIAESQIECGSTFVNLTGCYKCDSGARVCLDSTASSYPAVFRMSCPNVIPQLKTISNKGTWCMNLPLVSERINMECETSCGFNKNNILIHGNLVYIPNRKPNHSNSSISTNDVSESFITSGIRWLTALSWTSYFYLMVSLVIGIILTYIILWVLVPILLGAVKTITKRAFKTPRKKHVV